MRKASGFGCMQMMFRESPIWFCHAGGRQSSCMAASGMVMTVISSGCHRRVQTPPVTGQARPHIEAPNARFESAARPIACFDCGTHALAQAELLLIDALQVASNTPMQDA